MTVTQTYDQGLLEEFEALQRRLMELEEIEVMRISEEQERFDSLQVLDEYAKQIEESRDKLARLLRAGTAVQEAKTVQNTLQRVVNAIGEAGWSSVTVNVFENWDIVMAAYHGCTEDDIEFLQTHRRAPEERAKLFGPDSERYKISRSYFIPAEKLSDIVPPDQVVPGRRTPQPGDTWDAMDLAYVPLYGADGRVIGAINCDDPTDGRRPTAETFFYLELFADLAARKVEAIQMQDRQQRTEEALRESEEKYRTVFSRSGEGFFLMDELFRDCNSKACELWCCEPEDIIGHSPVEFSPELQPDGRRSDAAAKEYIGSAMRGEPQNFYWMHKRKDGVLIDCEVSLASVRVADETLIIAIVRDITERKRAELEQDVVLRILQIGTTSDTQEEMLRSIFAQIGRLVPIENYYLALHDPQLDMISFPIFIDEVDPPPKPRPFGNALTEWVIRHGRPLYLNPEQYAEMERRGEAKVHGTPALSWLGVPLVSQSKPFGALVVQSYRTENLFTDYHVRVFSTVAAQISTLLERKRSEEALRFTQFAVDCAGDGVFWIGPDAHLLYVNDAACKVLARSRAELLKMTWHDIDLYLDRNRWARDWEVVRIKSALSRETIHLTGDGRRIPVEVRANYVELRDHAILCVFARDISERKQSQRELITLRKAIEASGEAVFMADPEGVITFVNAEFARMYGYDPNEIIGHETYRILGGADLDDAAHTVFLERIRGGHVVKGRSVHRTKDGQLIDVEASANPILDENGKLAGFFSILRDVGERVREEQALRDSEESLRWLVDNFGEAVGIVDLEELFVYANPAMGSLFGLPSEELVGRSLGEFMTPEQFAVVRDYTQARRRGVRSRYTVDIRRANGDIRTLLITATPQFDGDGNVRNILTACKDVTGIKIIM